MKHPKHEIGKGWIVLKREKKGVKGNKKQRQGVKNQLLVC